MCTITLLYNENDVLATRKLAALLNSGLFVPSHMEETGIDCSDSSLFEEEQTLSQYEKEEYTLEEFRSMLIDDLNDSYRVKDAV